MNDRDQAACRCGRSNDGWPAEDGRSDLCQECWERECSESFWRLLGWVEPPTEVTDVD